MFSLRLDDRELLYIWAQLSERDRMKALRNPTRRAANAVRRAAQNSIKSAGIHNAAAIARTVRIANFKQVLGFKVALRNRGQKAMRWHCRAFHPKDGAQSWTAHKIRIYGRCTRSQRHSRAANHRRHGTMD